ncbi:MAG: murein hydrolase activator EnvC family protein [Lachnospiraceae bacterium]
MRRIRRIFNPKSLLLLVLVLITCTLYTSNYSNGASSSELQQKQEALKKELANLANLTQQTQNKLNQINGQKLTLEELSRKYDEELSSIQNQIKQLKDDIAVKQMEITANEEKLEQAMIDRDNQYEAMKLRIKYMYERGDQSEMEILLSASDFGDMINKSEYMEKIAEYDRAMLDKLIETENNIRETGEILANDKEILELQYKGAEETERSIQLLIQEKDRQLNAIMQNIGNLTNEYNKYVYDMNSIQKDIEATEEAIKVALAAEEEARRKAEEAGKNPDAGSGAYNGQKLLWPTNARPVRITCPFAGYVGHTGTDIAPTPGRYDDKAIAAAEGLVIYAQFDAAWRGGNMVCIKIADNMYIWYKHLSKIDVSVGDVVTAGQYIGQMGSTGAATGQHLHFELRIDGKAVDAMPYLNKP